MTLPLDLPADLSPAAPEAGEGRATGSVWRLILDVFLKNRLAVAGLRYSGKAVKSARNGCAAGRCKNLLPATM